MAWTRFNAGVVALGIAAIGLIGASPLDSAVIVNSGSTNTLGFRIAVQANGSATAATVQGRNGPPGAMKPFTLAPSMVKRFFADLAAARKAKAASEPCMKSVSFGTTTHITWQGWVSPDLDCPPSGSLAAALVQDVAAIRKAAGLDGAMLIHRPVEMRSP